MRVSYVILISDDSAKMGVVGVRKEKKNQSIGGRME